MSAREREHGELPSPDLSLSGCKARQGLIFFVAAGLYLTASWFFSSLPRDSISVHLVQRYPPKLGYLMKYLCGTGRALTYVFSKFDSFVLFLGTSAPLGGRMDMAEDLLGHNCLMSFG